ncbi:MAG: helix-turn-helix transcriptional regulator [Atribacterota bacterium]|nr:helix-turn-helix transcriptional regulator [Atribacterota bacterium]
MTTFQQQEELIKKLKERRENLGLSITETAFRIRKANPETKLSAATISRIENMKKPQPAYLTFYYWDKTLTEQELENQKNLSQNNSKNLASESNHRITGIVKKVNALPHEES